VLRSRRDGDRGQRSALCAGRNESAAVPVPGHREVRSRRDLLDLPRETRREHRQFGVFALQPLQFAPKVSVLQSVQSDFSIRGLNQLVLTMEMT